MNLVPARHTPAVLGPRLLIVGEATTVGLHYANRLAQWLGVSVVTPPATSTLGIDEVLATIGRPATARAGFVLLGTPRTVAEAVTICEATEASFDVAIDLIHAIDMPVSQDERYLRAWLDGMGVLTAVDARLPSQQVWQGLLDAIDPVLWGTGERVG